MAYVLGGAICAATQAQQAIVDWRLIGMTASSPAAYVFYDANGVRKLPNGRFEAWLKTLPGPATEKAASKLADDQAHLDHMTKKIAAGYVPPVGLDHELSSKELTGVVLMEEVANASSVQPVIRMLEEIDCENRVSRDLSLQAHLNGQDASIEKTSEWQHLAPETNMSRLHLALCH